MSHYEEQIKAELKQKKYKIIYADPPWHYGSKAVINNSTGSEIKALSEHYPTMSLKELNARGNQFQQINNIKSNLDNSIKPMLQCRALASEN